MRQDFSVATILGNVCILVVEAVFLRFFQPWLAVGTWPPILFAVLAIFPIAYVNSARMRSLIGQPERAAIGWFVCVGVLAFYCYEGAKRARPVAEATRSSSLDCALVLREDKSLGLEIQNLHPKTITVLRVRVIVGQSYWDVNKGTFEMSAGSTVSLSQQHDNRADPPEENLDFTAEVSYAIPRESPGIQTFRFNFLPPWREASSFMLEPYSVEDFKGVLPGRITKEIQGAVILNSLTQPRGSAILAFPRMSGTRFNQIMARTDNRILYIDSKNARAYFASKSPNTEVWTKLHVALGEPTSILDFSESGFVVMAAWDDEKNIVQLHGRGKQATTFLQPTFPVRF